MAPHLLRKAGQAVALNAVANWTTLVGSFLSIIVIARILSPADYGVFVMALVAVSLPEVIATGTLGDSLIQRKDIRPGHINSVFLQSMVLAIAFWLVLILLAPTIAQWLNNPAITPVLIVTGAVLPIGAVIAVPAALLQKDLRYKEITAVDVMGTFTASLVGIALALLLRNEWALVGMELSRRIVRLVGFVKLAGWVPRVESNWTDMKELTRFNLANGTSKVTGVIDGILPKTLIGITLGPASVGVFNLADRLYVQARSALIDPFAAVAMPLASMVQEDRKSLHESMENATRFSALIAYPTFIGGLVIAPVAIPLLFGEKWIEAVPIFQVFMLIGLRAPMSAIFHGVLRGVGRPDAVFLSTLVSILTTILLLTATHTYGLVAIALALLCKQVITFTLGMWLIQKIVGYPIWRQLKAGSTAFFAAALMGVVVWLLMKYLPAGPGPILRLAAIILLGALTYGVALFALMPQLGRRVFKAMPVLLSGQPREALRLVRGVILEH